MDLTLPFQRVDIYTIDSAGNAIADVQIRTNNAGNQTYTIGTDSFSGYSFYSDPAIADNLGHATLWLLANPAYDLTITPPSESPFSNFTLVDFSVDSDKVEIVSLQFPHNPPQTMVPVDPFPNEHGIYPVPVTVTLTATAFPSFNNATIFYTIDSGVPQTYVDSFVIPENGHHVLEYWAVDNIGVFEVPSTLILDRTYTVGVFSTPP